MIVKLNNKLEKLALHIDGYVFIRNNLGDHLDGNFFSVNVDNKTLETKSNDSVIYHLTFEDLNVPLIRFIKYKGELYIRVGIIALVSLQSMKYEYLDDMNRDHLEVIKKPIVFKSKNIKIFKIKDCIHLVGINNYIRISPNGIMLWRNHWGSQSVNYSDSNSVEYKGIVFNKHLNNG